METLSEFTFTQLALSASAALMLVISFILFSRKRIASSVAVLMACALCIGLIMASLDPYLNLWDEQFHALVAKNMISEPLHPVLYADPVLGYDYKNWTENHTWLHKPPLFLWQMAASMKVFGVSPFAARLPSVIMHAIMVFFIFRSARYLVNERTAYYSAVLYTFAHFPLELISGKYTTDHNDAAFLFYLTGAVWSWIEYQGTGRKRFLVLTGLFSGCAVLVKWLTGMLVIAAWSFVNIFDRERRLRWKEVLYAGFISLLVFLPWQFYTYFTFPVEAKYESDLNTRHFFEAVEMHTGDWLYHIKAIYTLYGSSFITPFLILFTLIVLLFSLTQKRFRIFILFFIGSVYVFFTLAATKMPAFTLIVAPLVFISFGNMLYLLEKKLQSVIKQPALSNLLIITVLGIACILVFDPFRVKGLHTLKYSDLNRNRHEELRELEMIKSLPDDDRYVIFNADLTAYGYIPVMFHTNHIAYGFIPDDDQIETALKAGYKVAVFHDSNLPESLNRSNVLIIDTNR